MKALFVAFAAMAAGTAIAANAQLGQIMAAREQKLDQARAVFEKAKSQADAEAVRQLKLLVASRTRNGDADGATAAKNAVEQVLAGSNVGPQSRAGDEEIRRQIQSRAIVLFGHLLAGDTDKAAAYVDPKWSEVVAPAAVKGVLGLISGALKLQQVRTTADIQVERITIGMKRNEAKVEYSVRVGGKWHPAKPAYWILRDGAWYMGDEKHLANFK